MYLAEKTELEILSVYVNAIVIAWCLILGLRGVINSRKDYAQSIDFYLDVLGVVVLSFIPIINFLFLVCNILLKKE